MKLLILFLLIATNANARLSHEQIVQELRSEKGAHTSKKGRVLFLPSGRTVDHKKHKHGKHTQQLGRKRVSSPTNELQTPTPSISPSPFKTVITPSSVDLRGRDTPVASQVGPYCTAYSLAAGIANSAGDHKELSVAHVWSFYHTYSVEAAAEGVPSHPITEAKYWPLVGSTPDPDFSIHAKTELVKITEIDEPSLEGNIERVKQNLQLGHPIYLGIAVPRDMASCFATIRPNTSITSGGHAVLVVGYRDDSSVSGGGYLIIKNSWGTDCGDGGYQYMAYSVCGLNKMYCYFYSIDDVKIAD